MTCKINFSHFKIRFNWMHARTSFFYFNSHLQFVCLLIEYGYALLVSISLIYRTTHSIFPIWVEWQSSCCGRYENRKYVPLKYILLFVSFYFSQLKTIEREREWVRIFFIHALASIFSFGCLDVRTRCQ